MCTVFVVVIVWLTTSPKGVRDRIPTGPLPATGRLKITRGVEIMETNPPPRPGAVAVGAAFQPVLLCRTVHCCQRVAPVLAAIECVVPVLSTFAKKVGVPVVGVKVTGTVYRRVDHTITVVVDAITGVGCTRVG